MKCPVCGKYEFEEAGDFDICPVCRFENDNIQCKDHNFAGGANPLSVNEMRIERFLLENPQTRERALMLYEKYGSESLDIMRKYAGQSGSDDEAAEYRAARKRYLNALNELLQSLNG